MIRLMPWGVGASELVAFPPARARVHGLRRLTAPTHSPWFWLVLWIATAAAGVIAQIPPLMERAPPVPVDEVLHNLSGVSFAACGLIAWHRRPDSAVGPMLTVTGLGVLLSAILGQVDSPLAFTLVLLLGELWIALYAALILSLVTGGRLTTRIDMVLVEAFVFGLLVMQFAVQLFLPDERNLLLVWPDAGIADALTKIQWAILAGAALGVAAATAPRRRGPSPSPPRRPTAGAWRRAPAAARCSGASAASCPACCTPRPSRPSPRARRR